MIFPRNLAEIDVTWIDSILPFPVSDFRMQRISEGYMSDVYRVLMEPDDRSIILKFHATEETARDLANRFRSYEKEHYFYAELAKSVDVRVPSCYFNFYGGEDGFLLGLEDTGTNLQRGLSDKEAKIAINSLVSLHATPIAGEISGISNAIQTAALDLESANLSSLFRGKVEHLLSQYARRSKGLLPHLIGLPQVFSHMDFRLENLSFSADKVTIFDWGEFGSAPAGFDLAYFTVTSLSVEQRRRLESDLISIYVKNSNSETYESILESYQLCLLPIVYMPWLMNRVGDRLTAKRLARRLSAAIHDHYSSLVGLLDLS